MSAYSRGDLRATFGDKIFKLVEIFTSLQLHHLGGKMSLVSLIWLFDPLDMGPELLHVVLLIHPIKILHLKELKKIFMVLNLLSQEELKEQKSSKK